jgi:hypothetical protein
MPRSAESSLDRFDQEYPEPLPERLGWLEKHFRVGRDLMLRLMGLSPEEATTGSTREWATLVRDYEPQADQVEHLLTHYLAYFDYDVERARAFASDFSRKVAAGSHRLSDAIPALAAAKTPADEERVLIEAARQEGASLLSALARLLGSASDPAENDDTAGRPRSSRRRRPPAS